MMIDIAKEIGATSRHVARQHTEEGEIVAVTMERLYAADGPDVWQAIPTPIGYAAGSCRLLVISVRAGISSSKVTLVATS